METWELWYPNAASGGLLFARCRIDAADVVLVHAAPSPLRIEVRNEDGGRAAEADQLAREGAYVPMTRLRRSPGGSLLREDDWPTDEDIGRVVLLPGGEAGVLTSWWNADDGSEWRWSVEFYNRR